VLPASGAVDTDGDGVLRRLLFIQVSLPTFPIRAAEALGERSVAAAKPSDNHAWIDFAGPPGTYKTYSMGQVIAGQVPASKFAKKIVLVGVTAPIAKDVFVTSASSTPMAGVEVQANSVDTVLRAFPLRSASPLLCVALIVGLAVTPVLLSLVLNPLAVGMSSLALAVLFCAIVEQAFVHGLLLCVPEPLIALALGASGVIAEGSVIERRKRQSLEALLDGFLRPTDHAFFICYRRDQSSFVARSLLSALTTRFGDTSVFMDVATLNPGQPWPRRIQEAILGCRAMLVIIGPNWLSAVDGSTGLRRLDDPEDWVRQEVEAGLARPEVAIIPVLVDGATMPGDRDLPDSLHALQDRNAFVLTGANLDEEVDSLIAGIQRGQLSPLRRADSAITSGPHSAGRRAGD